MIGMKDQCFGVEVEMTGITREQAATALAAYFATDARYVGGAYCVHAGSVENDERYIVRLGRYEK